MKIPRSNESDTRRKIDFRLQSLGWIIDGEDPKYNVTTERTKTKEQNKKIGRNRADYILYKSNTDTPIAIIESKRKGEDLNKALDDARKKYAEPLDIKIIFAFDGGLFKTLHLDDDKELMINNELVQNFLSESDLLKFIDEGSSISDEIKTTKFTREELIKIFADSNDLLRKEGLREGSERFTEFSNILFLKYISEIEERHERKGKLRELSDDLSWDEIRYYDEKKRIKHINNTIFKELATLYGSGDKTIFKDKLLIKNPRTLTIIIEKLSQIDLLNAESDVGGDAFEYFLKASVTVGNDLGEYFTPRHIINLMIDLVEPRIGDTIYDPACGTGGFLIASFEKLEKMIGENNEPLLKELREHILFGREISSTSKIAKMNMILHGDGHNNIRQMDSLAHPIIKDKFKITLANIPYSQETEYGNLYPIETNNADVIFILHILDSLQETGRAAVIVPQGFLFRGGIVEKTRRHLLNNANIKAIISLPSGVFKPYTGVSTAIIYFEKGNPTEKIWFYHMKNDGYTLNDKRKFIDGIGDIDDIKQQFKQLTNIEHHCHLANLDEIKENEFNLNIPRYVDISEPDEQIDIQEAFNNIKKMKLDQINLEIYVNNDLKYLGFST